MSNLGRGVNWSAFQHIASMFAKAGEAKAAGIQGMAEGISGGIRMIGAKREQRRQEAAALSQRKEQERSADELAVLRMMQSDERIALDTDLEVRKMQLQALQDNYGQLFTSFNKTPIEMQTPDMEREVLNARQKYEAARDSLLPWWQESVKAWQGRSSARMQAYYEQRGVQMPKALAGMSASPIARLQDGLGDLQPQPAAQPIQGAPQAQVPAPAAAPAMDMGGVAPAAQPQGDVVGRLDMSRKAMTDIANDEEYQNRLQFIRSVAFPGEQMVDVTVDRNNRNRIFEMLDASTQMYEKRRNELVEEIKLYGKNPNLTDRARDVLRAKETELLKVDLQLEAMTKEIGDAKQRIQADFDVRLRRMEEMAGEQRVSQFRSLVGARGLDIGETQEDYMKRQSVADQARSATEQIVGNYMGKLSPMMQMVMGKRGAEAVRGSAAKWAGGVEESRLMMEGGGLSRLGDPEVLALEDIVRRGKDPIQAAKELKEQGTQRSAEPIYMRDRLDKTLNRMQSKATEGVAGKYMFSPDWKSGDPSVGNLDIASRIYMVASFEGDSANEAAVQIMKKEGAEWKLDPTWDPAGKTEDQIKAEVAKRGKFVESVKKKLERENPDIVGLTKAKDEEVFWQDLSYRLAGLVRVTDQEYTITSDSTKHLRKPVGDERPKGFPFWQSGG